MKLDKAIKVNKSLLDGTYDHRDEVWDFNPWNWPSSFKVVKP